MTSSRVATTLFLCLLALPAQASHSDLAKAAFKGDYKTVIKLFKKGVDPNEETGGESLLARVNEHHWGAQRVIRILIRHGADWRKRYSGDHALIFAAREGQLQVVKEILKGKPNVDFVSKIPDTKYGQVQFTALGAAASGGKLNYDATFEKDYLQIANLLIKAGADIKRATEAGTPLHIAAESCHLGIMKALIDAGAPLDNTQSFYRENPIEMTIKGLCPEGLKMLLKAGAKLQGTRAFTAYVNGNQRTSQRGDLIERVYLEAPASVEIVEIAQILANEGLKPDARVLRKLKRLRNVPEPIKTKLQQMRPK